MALKPKPLPEGGSREVYRGIAVPVTRYGGDYWKSRRTIDLIWSSIALILGTPVGTRIMLPEFGSRIAELLFEPNDEVLEALANRFVQDALSRWETRVDILEVNTVVSEHEFQINMRILLKSTGGVHEAAYTVYRNRSLKIVQQFYASMEEQ